MAHSPAKLWFDYVAVGQELPVLTKMVTTRQLVMYAGASGDFVPIHYDKDKAIAAGHNKVIVHGALKSAFIAQMIDKWVGDSGRLTELSVSYRAIDYVDDQLTCRGLVTGKRVDGETGIVEIDVSLENSKGQVTTLGRAQVGLPIMSALDRVTAKH